MSKKKSASFRRKISDYCRLKMAEAVKPKDFRLIHNYLLELIDEHQLPPRSGQGFKWDAISTECGIELADFQPAKGIIENTLTAIEREFPNAPRLPHKSPRHPANEAGQSPSITRAPKVMQNAIQKPRKRRGVPPRPIVEFPAPLQEIWNEPCSFEEALRLHMRRHGDTAWHLHRAVTKVGETFNRRTIVSWKLGEKTPRSVESFKILARIERRYRLPSGYFKAKLPHPSRAAIGHQIEAIGAAERRRLAWHLPDDFDDRSAAEQEEILEWVRRVVVAGSTEYRRYQAAAMKTRFAIRFPSYPLMATKNPSIAAVDEISKRQYDEDPDLTISSRSAPQMLADEMKTLLHFKTSTLTSFGYQRNGIWGRETAAQKVEHLGLLFGALSSAPDGAVQGRGVLSAI